MDDRILWRVLPDGALLFDVDARLQRHVTAWTGAPTERGWPSPPAAHVFLHQSVPIGIEAPGSPPSLRTSSMAVWMRPELGRSTITSTDRDCVGSVDLDVLRATLVSSGYDGGAPRLHQMLTLASALLLGRLGRALVHAAAVICPGEAAWLLVGADGCGAATAAVRLVAAGWECLAVERVVLRLSRAPGEVVVEGWPSGAGVESPRFGAGGRAPLAGVLAVRAEPTQPTRLLPEASADLLDLLAPSSPWLRLDPRGAGGVVRALRNGVQTPVRELRLGLDSYSNDGRLAEVLGELR